jgi:hypothetical protein
MREGARHAILKMLYVPSSRIDVCGVSLQRLKGAKRLEGIDGAVLMVACLQGWDLWRGTPASAVC